MRENRILVILGAVLLGQLWALVLPQSGARNPTPFRLSVTGWKKLWKSSLSDDKAKKQARAIQDDLVAQAQGFSKKLHFWSR